MMRRNQSRNWRGRLSFFSSLPRAISASFVRSSLGLGNKNRNCSIRRLFVRERGGMRASAGREEKEKAEKEGKKVAAPVTRQVQNNTTRHVRHLVGLVSLAFEKEPRTRKLRFCPSRDIRGRENGALRHKGGKLKSVESYNSNFQNETMISN